MAETEKTPGIKVVVWNGTRQETHVVATYHEAMAIVDDRHSNTHGPCFYDSETGEKLYDHGDGLVTEGGLRVH